MSLWRASVSRMVSDRAPRCMRARHTAFALPGPLLPASMALLVRPAHRLFKSPRMRGMAGTRLGIHATFGWKMRSISGVHPAFSACGRLRTLRTRGGCAHAKIGDLARCAWVGPHHAAPVACLWVGGGPSGVSSVLNQLLPISDKRRRDGCNPTLANTGRCNTTGTFSLAIVSSCVLPLRRMTREKPASRLANICHLTLLAV